MKSVIQEEFDEQSFSVQQLVRANSAPITDHLWNTYERWVPIA